MIIVTGGTGFIGSNIIHALEQHGYKDIAIVDVFGTGDKWRNVAKREIAAIVDPKDLSVFLAKHSKEIQAVIHMGAISTTTETDVDLIMRSNFTLSWELWCFCRDFGKQFIYASSAATYGDGGLGFNDQEDIASLRDLRPLNPYGWSKALFDIKVAREKLEGRPCPPQYAGLKFFNVYGPNEYHKGGQKSVVAHIFPQVQEGKEVKLFKSYHPDYEDGWQLRDFVWVGDCVSVVLWLLANPSVSGLFNVGSGEARSFYDLATACFRAMDQEPLIGFREMPEELQGKYQYYTCADLTKLRAKGYMAAMTSLEDGVARYVRGYLAQADPYL